MNTRFSEHSSARHRFPAHFEQPWRKRLPLILGLAAALALFAFGLVHLEFSLARMWKGVGQLGTIITLMVPPTPDTWARFMLYFHALLETLAIAFLGTLLAAILAFPISMLAARNIMTQRVVQFMARRSLDTIRGVDTLIWALIWINVVGLGPFAGVLAIMSSDIGAFGKLFSEAAEATDKKPVEGVLSTGGTHTEAVRFGIIPQILPVIASQVLYYFESNTRSATIIGIVGAGGIGLHLSEQIRTLEWQHVSFLVLMVLVTVSLIDFVSSRIRFSIIGPQSR